MVAKTPEKRETKNMSNRLNSGINTIFNLLALSLAVIIPLFFINLTSEFYETPKFIALILLTGFLLLLWSVKWVLNEKISLTRTPLDLPFILLLIVFIISTFFSSSRPVSILGNLPRVHGGLATFLIYIILYFILVSNIKKVNVVKNFLHLLLASGVVLSILGIAYYLGKPILPLSWTAFLNFTPSGSNFSTVAFLTLLLPLPLVTLLKESESKKSIQELFKKPGPELLHIIANAGVLTLFGIVIALTGSFATWVAGLIAVSLTLFAVPASSIKKNFSLLLVPVALVVLVSVVAFMPIGGSKNILHKQAQAFPVELQLPLNISWKVSVSAFRDSPFWGTGPASYLFDFTTYKPAEFNNLKFWNTRFDQAFNEYFQFLATLGAMGLSALLLLTIVTISLAFKALSSPKDSTLTSLSISVIIFFILLALHSSTLVLWSIGIILLALFVSASHLATGKISVEESSSKNKVRLDTFPSAIAIILLVAIGIGFYFTGNFALADYRHRLALNSVEKGQALDAYNQLVLAERLNTYVDLYRTDLAQTNFALANTLAASKGPSESSPAGSLTDTDKQNIQTFLSQAIAEGRVATSLSPNNAGNWEVLGSIYRQISGVAQNALSFSLDSYGKAIQKDPMNPSLRLTVGGIYYSVKSYDLAIRFFTDAINLKPDYTNGYYNLAIALRDKGDLKTAQAIAEKLVSLIQPKEADYQKAADLLSELKSKDSTAAAKLNLETDKTSSPSALQSKKLPKVLDLPKTDKVSTPPAVKK